MSRQRERWVCDEQEQEQGERVDGPGAQVALRRVPQGDREGQDSLRGARPARGAGEVQRVREGPAQGTLPGRRARVDRRASCPPDQVR